MTESTESKSKMCQMFSGLFIYFIVTWANQLRQSLMASPQKNKQRSNAKVRQINEAIGAVLP